MAVELRRVQEQVTDLGLGWQPGDTVHTELSLMRIRSRTGAVPPDGHRSMGEREVAAAAAHRQASAATAAKLPSKIDWRDNNGNFVTPVRDQQFCGSCVAFGTAAVLESMIMIKAGVSKLPIDLSEAQLYFCYGPDHGALPCPDGGWWPDDSFACLKRGVVDEACFPYTDDDQPCKLGSDAAARLSTASSFVVLESATAMKRHLATVGPLAACFTVYEDFAYYYTGGVYRYHEKTSGEYVSGHCVCIIGYDDAKKCWIAKNSWGKGWGAKGFVRIGYGECGIDASMWGIDGAVTSPVLKKLTVVGTQGRAVRRAARRPNGTWGTVFETTAVPASAGALTAVDSVGIAGKLHVVALSSQGTKSNLWHNVRDAAGAWQPAFVHVEDAQDAYAFSSVGCTSLSANLHVVAVAGGELLHGARKAAGTWQSRFTSVPLPSGVDALGDVGCAGLDGKLHVVAVLGGALWHTVRNTDLTWRAFTKIKTPASAGPFTAVACAAVSGDLQVVGIGTHGAGSNLWHTIRKAGGEWQATADNVSDPGHARDFDAVSCTAIGGDLQVIALLNGVPWHTARAASGKWLAGFDTVPTIDGGPLALIGCAAV